MKIVIDECTNVCIDIELSQKGVHIYLS